MGLQSITGAALEGVFARAISVGQFGCRLCSRAVATLPLLAAITLLAGCAPVPRQQVSEPVTTPVWPVAPDLPRFIYQYTLRVLGDVQPGPPDNSLRNFLTGDIDVGKMRVLERPGAIVARHGRIYVTDMAKHAVVVFDIPKRRIFAFGVRDDAGRLNKPSAIALDDWMQVYVIDTASRKLNVYDALGLYLRSFGGPADFERPTGVAVDPDGERIYVIDRSSNETEMPRIVCFDRHGNKLFTFGKLGDGPGEFNIPLHAVMDRKGQLHVLDAGNFRVQVFDREGKHLRSIGGIGVTPGSFARPRGIAVDDQGLIYVSDANFGNVQLFDAEGQVLLAVGEVATAGEDRAGRYGLAAGVAVDETGRLYVVDELFAKVEVLRRLTETQGRQLLIDRGK